MKIWHQILILIGVGCFATLPVLIYGISVQSDDGATHVVWYTSFADQFWAGEIYPRWLSALNDGLGSPAFFYYPPVPYFITSLLRPIFANDPIGVHQLGVSASISVLLSGIFTWRWSREWTDDLSALIAGVAFMITPYHLVIDLYTRTAFAELWSFAWIPLILFFVHRVCTGKWRWSIAGLALSYALLIGTHLPTTLLFSPVPVVYALFATEAGQRLRSVITVSLAMSLGIGLAAIYLYPAMALQPFVFVDRMSLGHFSYSNWLLLSSFYYEKDVDLRPIYRITFVFVDLVVLAIAAYIFGRKSEAETEFRRIVAGWFAVAMLAIFMTTDLSRPVWALIPTLQKVQFPWRFGVVISVATTALLGLTFRSAWEARTQISRATVLFSALLWLPFMAWGFEHYANPVKPDDVLMKRNVIAQRRDQAEYRPRWSQTMDALDWNTSTNEDDWSDRIEQEYDALVDRTGASDPNSPRAVIASGSGHVQIVRSQPREITVHASLTTDSQLQIKQFYFPGWEARDLGSGTVTEVRPSEPDGLLNVDLPIGEHDVSIQLTRTAPERTGIVISAVSWAVLILYAVVVGGTAFLRRRRIIEEV